MTLVSGPTHLKVPYGITCIDVISAKDMYESIIESASHQDYIIMSAAVGDMQSKKLLMKKSRKMMKHLL